MADRLEQTLTELGDRIVYPATPALSPAVRARLEHRPTAAWRRLAFALAAVLLFFAATLAFSPTARRAVADLLGVAGIRISFGEVDARPPVARDLRLGDDVTLEGARSRVDFTVLVPDRLPDEIYVSDFPEGGSVSFVYLAGRDLPELLGTDIGMLVTQFSADLDLAYAKKLVAGGSRIKAVTIDGSSGYWLTGEPHEFFYVDADGVPRRESSRLAGNTLVFERDGLTIRIESDLSLKLVMEIASSLH